MKTPSSVKASTAGQFESRIVQSALILAGAILVVAYVTAAQAPAAGTYHDDGIYAVTARAMAEGRGYRIISLPDSPIQTKYPVLFPWLLSLVWRVAPDFPENLPLLRLVPLGSAVVWLWLSWRLLRQWGATPTAASVVVTLTAASPWVMFLSTALLSETLFAALLVGALLALAKSSGTAQKGWCVCAMAGALTGACILTRAAGIAVLVGGLAWLGWRQKWAGAAAFGVVAALVTAPWLAWVALNGVATDSYYSATPYGTWNIVFAYSWPAKWSVLFQNILYASAAPAMLYGVTGPPWVIAVCVIVMPLLVATGLWLTRTHPASWCIAAMLAMTLAWVWPPMRFLVPLVPLVAWQVMRSLAWMPRAVGIVCIIGVLLVALWGTKDVAVAAHRLGSVWPHPQLADDWREILPLLQWIRRETPDNAILAATLDPMYFLYTGRKAIRAFTPDSFALFYMWHDADRTPLGTVEDFKHRLLGAGVDYCVVTPARGFGESPYLQRLVDELMAKYPGSLTVAAGSRTSGYVVYEVDGGALRATLRSNGRR